MLSPFRATNLKSNKFLSPNQNVKELVVTLKIVIKLPHGCAQAMRTNIFYRNYIVLKQLESLG